MLSCMSLYIITYKLELSKVWNKAAIGGSYLK